MLQHTWRTITSADEIKSNEMNEMNVAKYWNEICGGRKLEKSWEKNYPDPVRAPRNPHGITGTWTLSRSNGRKTSNRLLHGTASRKIRVKTYGWFFYPDIGCVSFVVSGGGPDILLTRDLFSVRSKVFPPLQASDSRAFWL